MELHVPRLKQDTAKALSQAAYDPRRLALLHSGVALGASLILTVVSFVLTRQVDSTGGLAGIGTRTVLQSVQTVLQLVLTMAMPFWEVGFLFCAISMARGRQTAPADFTQGFRRFGPFLRLFLLQLAVYLLIGMLAIQVASMIFMLTPFAERMLQIIETLSQDTAFIQTGMPSEAPMEEMMQAAVPIYIILGIVFLVVAIPVFYRLRLSRYILLEEDQPGALAAMVRSSRYMRGSCVAFLKLDLSFWWYYLLQGLCGVIAYADVLLPALGIGLLFDGDMAFFLFYGVYVAANLALAWRVRSSVETTYAMAYDSLLRSA